MFLHFNICNTRHNPPIELENAALKTMFCNFYGASKCKRKLCFMVLECGNLAGIFFLSLAGISTLTQWTPCGLLYGPCLIVTTPFDCHTHLIAMK